MKVAAILLVVFGLFAVNMAGFGLLAIGSTSMASVEGVAKPWMQPLLILLFLLNAPFLIYLGSFIADRKNQKKLEITYRSIVCSAWLAFPAAVALFILVGSKIVWFSLFFPMLQALIAVFILLRNKQFD